MILTALPNTEETDEKKNNLGISKIIGKEANDKKNQFQNGRKMVREQNSLENWFWTKDIGVSENSVSYRHSKKKERISRS